jgi:hypothetical protein
MLLCLQHWPEGIVVFIAIQVTYCRRQGKSHSRRRMQRQRSQQQPAHLSTLQALAAWRIKLAFFLVSVSAAGPS